MVLDSKEKKSLIIIALLMGIELVTDLSLAQVPIIGDMANATGDSVLNVIQLGIIAKAAKDN